MAKSMGRPASAWASSDVETCTGCLKRGTATVQAGLPLAAAVLGMAAFGIIVHFSG